MGDTVNLARRKSHFLFHYSVVFRRRHVAVSGEDAPGSSEWQKRWCSQPSCGEVALGIVGWEQFPLSWQRLIALVTLLLSDYSLKALPNSHSKPWVSLVFSKCPCCQERKIGWVFLGNIGLSFCAFPVSSHISELPCSQLFCSPAGSFVAVAAFGVVWLQVKSFGSLYNLP